MHIFNITHVSLDLASPTRMERYLREAFGLQTLRHGWWRGDYVRVLGSPHYQTDNSGILELRMRQSTPQGELNHLGMGVADAELSAEETIAYLENKGIEVDTYGDGMLYGPEELHIQVDSFTQPRPIDPDDPTIVMQDLEVDPDLPCLVRGIHHVALDVAVPSRMANWLGKVFDAPGRRSWARKGWYISKAYYPDGPLDSVGRPPGLMPLFRRAGQLRARLNHIAFDFADADEAIGILEARGIKVDVGGDAMMHGPEGIWYQIDSRDKPYPQGHYANDSGVPYYELL